MRQGRRKTHRAACGDRERRLPAGVPVGQVEDMKRSGRIASNDVRRIALAIGRAETSSQHATDLRARGNRLTAIAVTNAFLAGMGR